jgi:hypothetical protein
MQAVGHKGGLLPASRMIKPVPFPVGTLEKIRLNPFYGCDASALISD